MTGLRPWAVLVLALLCAGIVYAALGPADWQVRLGLHWLVEHALAFFTLTLLVCAAYPKPMRVAVVLLPFVVGIEMAQWLTPDRTPDIATALVAAASVSLAALLADGVLAWRRRRKSP